MYSETKGIEWLIIILRHAINEKENAEKNPVPFYLWNAEDNALYR